MLSALLTCFISIIHVQAFVITQPDSTGWPRNVGMMTVRWDTSPSDPPVFTMLLRDASQLSVVNPLAVAANVPSALDAFELNLPTVPVSQTYQLLFVDPRNLTRVLAASSIFPITNSNSTTISSSEAVTQSTFTVTLTLSSSASSTIPPTTSLATVSTTPPTSAGSSTTSTSSTPASETRFTTSTLGTVPPATVTVTVPSNPDASFVPINAAERPRAMSNWAGLFIIAMVSFHLGGL